MMLLAAEKPKSGRRVFARLWGYLRRRTAALLVIFLLIIVAAAVDLVNPLILRTAIDDYVMAGRMGGLPGVVALLAGVALLRVAANWLQAFLMVGVAQRTVFDLRRALFTRLQALSVRYYDEHSAGDLMSRFTNDLDNVSTTLSDSVSRFFLGTIRLLGAVSIMFYLSWRLALISLATVPIVMGLVRWVSRHTLKGYRDQQEALGTLNGLIEETITGARVIKAHACEPRVLGEFDEANARLRSAAMRAMTFAMLLPSLMHLANNLSFAVTTGAGAWMAIRGWVSVGTIVAFLRYSEQFGRPLNEIANVFNTIQAALAGAERVFEVIDQEPETTSPPDAVPLGRVTGDIEFDDVTFAYEPGVPVLRNVSFHARPGQRVALVGPTGAGKTTMVNVLARFYDVDSGTIRIDGCDLRRFRKDDLRRQLGIVLQDSFLFGGSVMENIRYGRLEASDDEVVEAARAANADAFIRHLPRGYHSTLAERGANLSQGQRQLLTVARALLADPAILVLDEATSSVDTRTERHIQEALGRLMTGRTSLVIAHRLSTIRDAEMILVIDGGLIVERGRHADLMERRGFYHRLYVSQFKGHAAPE